MKIKILFVSKIFFTGNIENSDYKGDVERLVKVVEELRTKEEVIKYWP